MQNTGQNTRLLYLNLREVKLMNYATTVRVLKTRHNLVVMLSFQRRAAVLLAARYCLTFFFSNGTTVSAAPRRVV